MINEKIDILNEFCERWDFINTDKEKFELLKKKINHLVKTTFNDTLISIDIVNQLKSHMGDVTYPICKSSIQPIFGLFQEFKPENDYNIYHLIINVSDVKKLMYYLQLLFLLEQATPEQKEKLYDGLQDIIQTSNLTNIVYLEKRNSNIIILPAGEPTLDKVLITQTIPALQEYEVAYDSYISAMKDFMDADNSNDTLKREIADRLRYSFERFLKQRFNQEKINVTVIIERKVKTFLEEQKVHSNIINMYVEISKNYFFYANDTSKHGAESISMEELEYLVYLMGSMIRLIHQLDQRPKLEVIEE